MKHILFLTLALALAAGPAAEARTRSVVHKPRLYAPYKPRTPKTGFRTVRVRRPDGTTMTGYRDSLGTHLTGPDGRTVHCRRQVGAADIDVACH